MGESYRVAVGEVAQPDAQEWFTTTEAAVYLRTTAQALRKRIARGSIAPDCWGGRGRGKEHMFRRSTLDRHYTGRCAA